MKDFRGLSEEQRDRLRFGESPEVTSPGGDLIVQCCGKLMVYDPRGFHVCQVCRRTEGEPTPEPRRPRLADILAAKRLAIGP
jgi:hypothetical protein